MFAFKLIYGGPSLASERAPSALSRRGQRAEAGRAKDGTTQEPGPSKSRFAVLGQLNSLLTKRLWRGQGSSDGGVYLLRVSKLQACGNAGPVDGVGLAK